MKKISLMILSLLLYISIMAGNLTTEKEYSELQIYSGNVFTNITPYPKTFNPYDTAAYSEDTIFYQVIKPVWYSAGIYKTDWSDFERGLYLSDSLPYVNGITAGFDNERFRIISGVYFFDGTIKDSELKYQQDNSIDGNSDRSRIPIKNFGYAANAKTLAIHRLEYIPVNWLRISVNELELTGGKYPDLMSFNPMDVLHNTFGEGYANAMLGADILILPLKGWAVYGQFAMDDFVVPKAESGAEDYKPTAMAYALGTKYIFKNNNFYIVPKLEYYKIFTWMYNRWQILQKFTGRYNGIDYPMGFDYGNDMEGFLLGIDFFNNKDTKYKIIFEWYKKGLIDINWDYNDKEKKKQTSYWGGYPPFTDFIKISFIFDIKFYM